MGALRHQTLCNADTTTIGTIKILDGFLYEERGRGYQPKHMLGNAHAALRDLGASCATPPNGTGPLGAPGGGGQRWITRDDVIVWNSATTIPSADVRTAHANQLQIRPYRPTPNALRDYQCDAVRACNPEPGVFRSGTVNMECGTGKTWVASELIRRSGSKSVVLTQHTVSVAQLVTHLQGTLGINAVSLQDENERNLDAYDVIVTTYNRLARVVKLVDEHRERIQHGTHSPSYSIGDRFLMQRMCTPFGLLILDEVHTVVADKFVCACRLMAHAVVGFSGSMVREDNRIDSLTTVVGPVLFTYGNTERDHEVHVHHIPIDDVRVRNAVTRTASHQTIRALNPHKVRRLLQILRDNHDKRVIVFCDAVQPTEILRNTILQGRCLVLNGKVTSREARDEMIEVFAQSSPGSLVLLCTKVCDVSIDFPLGCVIVEYHLTTGSRQQEMQRCGRGTRGTDGAVVHHLVNLETDEERFSERRIEHLTEEMWGRTNVETHPPVATTDALYRTSCMTPLESLMRIKIDVGKQRVRKRPRHERLLHPGR